MKAWSAAILTRCQHGVQVHVFFLLGNGRASVIAQATQNALMTYDGAHPVDVIGTVAYEIAPAVIAEAAAALARAE